VTQPTFPRRPTPVTTPPSGPDAGPPVRALAILALPLLLLVAAPAVAVLYTDYRWFRSLDQEAVFTTLLSTRLGLGLVVGALAFALFYGNLRWALRASRGLGGLVLGDGGDGTGPQLDLGRLLGRLSLPLALLVALLAGNAASSLWETWLGWRHAVDFGRVDPLFGRDVGFYVFELPAYEAAVSAVFGLIAVSAAGAVGLYFLRGAIVSTPRGLRIHPAARLHLGALGALVFVVLAFWAWFETFHLFDSTRGPVVGASYADVHARLPALRVQVATAAVGAVLILAGARRGRVLWIGAAIALYLAVEVVGVQAFPALLHRFTVLPNEAEKEAPFIAHNIAATRAAYDLEETATRVLPAEGGLSAVDIARNQATTDNIRVWDHEPLLDTFAQIQEIRTYYEFESVDNDRYVLDGELRQTMVSARELDVKSLPKRTWINEHFVFTHGYGVTLGPVNEATPEGLPVLFVQDIPPVTEVSEIEVSQPAIYFGELVNDYVFVNSDTREFHYPSGEDNVYQAYEGRAGVRLDSGLTKAAMAIRFGELKVMLSDDLGPESRVLLRRNIRERAQSLAPFLRFDRDPYLVVRNDGRLAWVHDAYTASDRFPYAEPHRSGVSYIRNSVKVITDAYDGSVTFYVADPDDPIIQTWEKAFPQLFQGLDEMPDDLRAHLRYPEDIFRIQTEMFATYHMDQPDLLYNREDQWEIPTINQGDERRRLSPYYTVMRLPGEDEPEFLLMLPFTPQRKENLAAWMIARMDGPHLGEMVVYTFPKDRLVFGPQQIMNRINQDADIARQVSLWDQRGSEAIFGTLLVIPIEESLIYVSPLYLRAEGGRIPELKRVIVAYENQIAMEPTLDEALAKLFADEPPSTASAQAEAAGGEVTRPASAEDAAAAAASAGTEQRTGTTPRPATPAAATLPADGPRFEAARRAYRQAQDAQRAGDWAAYGDALRALGQALGEEEGADGAATGPAPAPPSAP